VNYLIDVKRNPGALRVKTDDGQKNEVCHIAPIFDNGELDKVKTKQMLEDVIKFSLKS
jgi:hypothetical protein